MGGGVTGFAVGNGVGAGVAIVGIPVNTVGLGVDLDGAAVTGVAVGAPVATGVMVGEGVTRCVCAAVGWAVPEDAVGTNVAPVAGATGVPDGATGVPDVGGVGIGEGEPTGKPVPAVGA